MKIEGFFDNLKKANETINQLQNQGFKNSFLDLNEHYMDNKNVERNLAGTETGPSLSDLVLGSGSQMTIDRSKAPLVAASPMVSGMGRINEIADINCKVVVEVDDENINTAKEIIKNMGGDLDNPNVDKPKIKDDDKIFDIAMDRLRNSIQ